MKKILSFLFLLLVLFPGMLLAADATAAVLLSGSATTGDPVFDLVLHIIPPGYRGAALLLVWAFPYLTRGYWAVVNNGGLINGVKAILFGLNSKVKVLLMLALCALLVSCGTNAAGEKTFLLLPKKEWIQVGKDTGVETLKTVPVIALKNYKERTAKQVVEVQPD
jgi:hypothetical protein